MVSRTDLGGRRHGDAWVTPAATVATYPEQGHFTLPIWSDCVSAALPDPHYHLHHFNAARPHRTLEQLTPAQAETQPPRVIDLAQDLMAARRTDG